MTMTAVSPESISRKGLSEEFAKTEREVSNLILTANLLKQSNRPGEAAGKYAHAAELEERLTQELAVKGLMEKYFSHFFSAASCWAQAGNIHQAISMCEELLSTPALPERLRDTIRDYLSLLRSRRDQWIAAWSPELVPASVS